MTEELKEQIHERVYNIKVPTLGFSRRDLFNIAMEYAEPREKRIAELEEENKTVSRKANEAIADKLLITAKYNEVLNDLNQQNDTLQKENAELKRIIDNDVDKKIYVQLAKKAKLADVQEDQLTKAKELLNEFLDFESSCMERGIYISDKIRTEAEQFLKETE